MNFSTHSRGLALTTAASLIWGTVYISIGVGLRYLGPYNLLFMRFLIASIAIVVMSAPFGKRLGLIREIKKPINWMLGFIYFLGFVFQYVGQNLTDASDTTLISNLAPILAPVVAFLVLKEKIGKNQGVALGLGFVGLFLIAGPRFSTNTASVIGDTLLFFTSISYAVFIILGKKYNSGGLGSSFAMIIAMTLFSIPFAINNGFSFAKLDFSLLGWAAILWMALPCGVLAISLYLMGLEQVSVGESSVLLLLQVITGLVLAAIVLGEKASAYEIGGAVAISMAVLFAAFSIDSSGPKSNSNISTEDASSISR